MKSPKSNLSFLIILLIGFVDYIGVGLVYPIFAVLLFDTANPILQPDASPEYRGAMLGLLIGLTPISQFFCAPLLGAFSDKKGRKKALTIGISGGCAGYLIGVAGIYFHSLSLLFLYRILVGASDATAAVAQATLADISTEENKAKRFAYLNSCIGFGFAIGPFLGGYIADPTVVSWFNYSTPLIFAGLMSLTNLILVMWKFPETRKKIEDISFDLMEGIHNLQRVFLLRKFKWIFLGGFFISFGWAFFNEFIPVLLSERFAFKLNDIGEFYGYTGLWYAIGALAATTFIHKWKPEAIAIVTLLLSAACMLVFVVVHVSVYIWWIVPLMMVGIAMAYPSATTIVSNRAGVDQQGEILGVYQSIGAAALGVCPILVGFAVGAYSTLAAWGGAFCLILSSFFFWFERSKTSREASINLQTSSYDKSGSDIVR